jgi:serine phosphatase RsbU (regulator of sigma subunit)
MLIRHIPFLADLPPDELRYLEEALNTRRYPAGEVVFQEGEVGDHLAIIVEGKVDVLKASGTADEWLLATMTQGDFIGEMSLLYPDRQRSASVRARSDVTLLEMGREDFTNLLNRHPELAFRILQEMSQRMRNAANVTILGLQDKNRQLAEAYQQLKDAQALLIEQEKTAHELRMARRIQEGILPKQMPSIPGWCLSAIWQPARQVSGDFYDYLPLSEDKLGLVIGDVTDKGMPAALVMAVTRSALRFVALSSAGQGDYSPASVIQQVNNLLFPDMPERMFVTCLYAILDLRTGIMTFANAGHNLPYLLSADEVVELRATGMPLGLLPGMTYDDVEVAVGVGDRVLFYTDGLVEAHDPERQMFGTPRLRANLDVLRQVIDPCDSQRLFQTLLEQLSEFTGPNWEPEDDITIVTFDRLQSR